MISLINRLKLDIPAIFLALIIVTLLLEVMLRLILSDQPFTNFASPKGLYVKDDIIKYKYSPGKMFNLFSDEFNTTVKINSEGFRDREHSVSLTKDKIFFLGDSFLAAIHVEDQYRFTELIQKEIRHVEVFNMGIGGYSTINELDLLEYILKKYQPKMVALCFDFATDIVGNHEVRKKTVVNGYLVQIGFLPESIGVLFYKLAFQLFEKSYFFSGMINKVTTFLHKQDSKVEENPIKMKRKLLPTFDQFKRFKALSNKHGFIPVVFGLHSVSSFNLLNDKSGCGGNENFLPARLVTEELKNIQIDYIDLFPIFCRDKDEVFFQKNMHFNLKGHYLAAQIMIEYLSNYWPSTKGH